MRPAPLAAPFARPFAHAALLAALLALVLLAPGCKPAQHGTFNQGAFEQTQFHYRVVAPDETLGPDWLLDNFFTSRSGTLEPKHSDIYVTRYELDMDGDGAIDFRKNELTYDLRYTHRQRASVVWLRSFPIPTSLAQTELRVLMRQYVDEIAGAGYEAVRLSAGKNIVSEKRYAAEIVDQADVQLAGMPAYLVTIDVANVDQLKLTPGTRHTRVQIVVAHTNFEYRTSTAQRAVTFPVLMMAGYANLPEDFDKDVGAFRRFLGQIEVDGHRGFTMPTPTPAQPAQAPTEPAPAPTEPAPAPTQPVQTPPAASDGGARPFAGDAGAG